MEVASRSAQFLKSIMEAPAGGARAAKRQPVLRRKEQEQGEVMPFWLLIQ